MDDLEQYCSCGGEAKDECENCGMPTCEDCLRAFENRWCDDCNNRCPECQWDPCMCDEEDTDA